MWTPASVALREAVLGLGPMSLSHGRVGSGGTMRFPDGMRF